MSTLVEKREPDRYHHGDLRRTLIAIGVGVLAEEGAEALSLRSVARRAGVSHNAPYQHFADKEALLAAIAEEGFRILSEQIDAGQSGLEPGRRETLVAAGQSYVRFAIDHPAHFQMMFGPMAQSTYPDLARAARASFERLVSIVDAGQRAGRITGGDPAQLALAIWSMLHGLSSNLIAQKIPPDIEAGRPAETLAAAQIDILWDGLRDRSGAAGEPDPEPGP